MPAKDRVTDIIPSECWEVWTHDDDSFRVMATSADALAYALELWVADERKSFPYVIKRPAFDYKPSVSLSEYDSIHVTVLAARLLGAVKQ